MAIDYPPVFINNYLSEKVPETLPYFSDPSNRMKFFPTQPTTIDALTETFPDAANDVFVVYDRMFRMRRGPFPHCRTEQILYYFYKTADGPEALIETVQLVADLLDNGDESAEDVNKWIKEKYDSNPGNFVAQNKISVTSRSLSSNVAELTTSQSHGINVGDRIVVSGVGAAFDSDGSSAFIVTETPAINRLRYSKTNIDVADFSAPSGATVGIAHPTVRFGTNDLAKEFFLPRFQEFKIYQLEEARDIIDFGTARTYAGNKVIIEYVWHKSAPIKK